MGNCATMKSDTADNIECSKKYLKVLIMLFLATMSKNNFNYHCVIGRGGFG